MYATSEIHCAGLESGLTSEVGVLTNEVVKAFEENKSSKNVDKCVDMGSREVEEG